MSNPAAPTQSDAYTLITPPAGPAERTAPRSIVPKPTRKNTTSHAGPQGIQPPPSASSFTIDNSLRPLNVSLAQQRDFLSNLRRRLASTRGFLYNPFRTLHSVA